MTLQEMRGNRQQLQDHTVPRGQARIRVMISANHEQKHLAQGLEAFEKVGREMGVI